MDRAILITALFGGTLVLAFMMLLSTTNVLVMRKMLNAPIKGTEDMLILGLVILVAIAVPLGGRTGAHIEIEVLESRMSVGFAKWSMVFLRLMGSVLMFIMSYQLVHAGQKATKFGETTQQLLISYEPFYYLLAGCIGVYAVVLVTDVFQLLTRGAIRLINLGDSE
ncbi:TRAP transporter small permease [Tropicibacter sp. Alg240-R139]|uniref:TRAP transporter small permease n=1 Tax=Tropicibacter sp. Alg240-R139 TaxID=2305991 RepID=UPI0013DFCDCB|nr:TRAP transporter small permease subunit [Tropicibacter sp. Alg240-R139]